MFTWYYHIVRLHGFTLCGSIIYIFFYQHLKFSLSKLGLLIFPLQSGPSPAFLILPNMNRNLEIIPNISSCPIQPVTHSCGYLLFKMSYLHRPITARPRSSFLTWIMKGAFELICCHLLWHFQPFLHKTARVLFLKCESDHVLCIPSKYFP